MVIVQKVLPVRALELREFLRLGGMGGEGEIIAAKKDVTGPPKRSGEIVFQMSVSAVGGSVGLVAGFGPVAATDHLHHRVAIGDLVAQQVAERAVIRGPVLQGHRLTAHASQGFFRAVPGRLQIDRCDAEINARSRLHGRGRYQK